MNPENSRSKVGLRVDHARAYYSSNSTNRAREAEKEKERDGASSEINLKWIPLYFSLSFFLLASCSLVSSEREVGLAIVSPSVKSVCLSWSDPEVLC